MVHTGGYWFYPNFFSALSKALGIFISGYGSIISNNSYFFVIPLSTIPYIIVRAIKMQIIE